ncbi:reverse transcriptase domain-containing protein, partial [Thiolapillus sp.]|uniref:reverse transcriptase domain-containing protein n=1 Tax=Thiolapillus sp. TaxID=2017437 RepID=UPI003AF7AFE1
EAKLKATILKSKPTSCSLDPLPTSLLLEFIDDLLPTLTNIINFSLSSGTFPSTFRSAVVKPLLKKASLDPNNLKNFRPVSKLSFMSKITEKVVLQQLLAYLTEHKLICPSQSAYRPHHSTETALLKITNDILLALDSGNVSLLTLLDLSAAFDTIDHCILLDRLQHMYGISGTALSW